MDEFFPRKMYWVPLSGIGSILIAWYVDVDATSLEKEIDSLDKLRYNWKDV